jgi:hypothetical protein
MSRKDYIKLANALRETVGHVKDSGAPMVAVAAVRRLAVTVADVCGADNDRFDRDKFIDACGL